MKQLFLSVVQLSLSASLLIGGFLIFEKIFAKRYVIRLRKLIWIMVFIRLLLPVTLQFPEMTKSVEIPDTIIRTSAQTDIRADVYEQSVSDEKSVLIQTENQAEQTVSANKEAPLRKTISVLDIFAGCWLFAAIGSFLLIWVKYFSLKSVLKRNAAEADGKMKQALRRITDKLEMKQPKMVLVSTGSSPFVMGFINPCIYVPTSAVDYPRLDLILEHECLYIKKMDLWIKLLISAVKCIHFFNPLVWIAEKQMDLDIEMAADEFLMSGKDRQEKIDYAESLCSVVLNDASLRCAYCTQFTNGKILKERIMTMLNNTKKKSGNKVLILCACLCIFTGSLLSCTVKEPNQSAYLKNADGEILYAIEDNQQISNMAEAFKKAADIEAPQSDQATEYYLEIGDDRYVLWKQNNLYISENEMLFQKGDDYYLLSDKELNKDLVSSIMTQQIDQYENIDLTKYGYYEYLQICLELKTHSHTVITASFDESNSNLPEDFELKTQFDEKGIVAAAKILGKNSSGTEDLSKTIDEIKNAEGEINWYGYADKLKVKEVCLPKVISYENFCEIAYESVMQKNDFMVVKLVKDEQVHHVIVTGMNIMGNGTTNIMIEDSSDEGCSYLLEYILDGWMINGYIEFFH